MYIRLQPNLFNCDGTFDCGFKREREQQLGATIGAEFISPCFQRIPPHFSIFDVVLEMRKQRPAAVQTQVSPRIIFPVLSLTPILSPLL